MTVERNHAALGITGATRLIGLIADPVVQARSPAMANAMLAERGKLGAFVFVPLAVPRGALTAVVTALRTLENFAGAVVSMPHKIAIATLLDDLTPTARLAGAVNVVRRDADGRLTGTMFDGEGFVRGLRDAGHEVAGRACYLAGAGGAASAIAFALAAHGCRSLTVVNRTATKAAALAARVRTASPAVDVRTSDDGRATYDVAVNATSLGMKDDDPLPLPLALLDRAAVVAECVVAPEVTKLLAAARDRGRAIHTGVPMLAAQIALMLDFVGAA